MLLKTTEPERPNSDVLRIQSKNKSQEFAELRLKPTCSIIHTSALLFTNSEL